MAGICREIVKAVTRSSGWAKVRSRRMELDGNQCMCCGKKGIGLQVHHIRPFHLEPELELELSNLITLCSRCHIFVGHLDYWKAYNPKVMDHAILINREIKARVQ